MSLIDVFRGLPEDEQEQRARTARAERAKALLNNEMFKDALQSVQDDVVRKITTCPINDLDGLRQYRLMYEILDLIANAIGQHVRTGVLADDMLKKIEQRRLFAVGK